MIICLIFLRKEPGKVRLTVDSNGNSLAQDEAIGTLECGHLAELVELQVLGRETISGHSLNELEVKTVLLCNSEQRRSARVALQTQLVTDTPLSTQGTRAQTE